jgi:hemolysin (HlyC) family protein
MNENDPSSAAASRPHRPSNEDSGDKDIPDSPHREPRPRFWARIKNLLSSRHPTLRDDLQVALLDSSESSAFSDGERSMLANVLKLAEMRVEDVMVPRADIEAADERESLGEVVEKLRESGHSRLPVFAETLDNIVGMIHIKDAVLHLTAPVEKPNGSPIKLLSTALKQKLTEQDLVRKVLFVPPSMPVADLLRSMQATRLHMAIVVDEYGGTDGLVTIEDLLESVVGEIEDEHDDQDMALVTTEGDNIYCADARASLEELQEVMGADFDPGKIGEEADTLGGLIFSLIDRVPVKGEVITKMKGFEFEILQADPRRVRRVRIVRRPRALLVRSKKRSETVSTPDRTAAE